MSAAIEFVLCEPIRANACKIHVHRVPVLFLWQEIKSRLAGTLREADVGAD